MLSFGIWIFTPYQKDKKNWGPPRLDFGQNGESKKWKHLVWIETTVEKKDLTWQKAGQLITVLINVKHQFSSTTLTQLVPPKWFHFLWKLFECVLINLNLCKSSLLQLAGLFFWWKKCFLGFPAREKCLNWSPIVSNKNIPKNFQKIPG